jgi:hypothetical protein
MKLKQKPTQAEIDAKIAAHKQAARDREDQAIRTLGAIEAEGLTIQHFRPTLEAVRGTFYGVSQTGGMTVAYRQQRSNSFVEIATAICHPGDGYDRKRGTQVAVEQFLAGHVIRIPLLEPTPQKAVEFLFREYFTFNPE